MNELSVQSMTRLLTLPYRRGAETLQVPIGADAMGWTLIAPYDFREYRARHGEDPAKPKYVIFPRKKTGRDALKIEFDFFLADAKTVLSGGVDAVTATLSVASTSRFPTSPPFMIRINEEIITVNAISGNSWTVARGAQGTAAVPHADGSSVEHIPTVLLVGINDTVTTITVRLVADVPLSPPFSIRVENEFMTVTAVAGNSWTVTRGAGGTTASSHSAGTPVAHTTSVEVPPRTFAGTSFVIPLPDEAGASLALLRFRQLPLPLPGIGSKNWGVVALLGNIAKLAWVIGWEKDQIRQNLQEIRRQRCRKYAHGFSLDMLGEDLRVPRFPAREYSFDENTIALYHLNDPVENNGEVTDETTRFGLIGHTGINRSAQSDVTGKFGSGFQFPGESGSGFIEIPTHADFDIAVDADFTIEAFAKADESSSLRTLIIKGQQDASGTLIAAGWVLSINEYRGIANNVKWGVGDSTHQFETFADSNIADGDFHHIAGVIDRGSQRARLFIDGQERSNVDISGLGPITNGEAILIGRDAGGNQFSGVVDEVRLSNITRMGFNPILGESDDAYRQRLGIFERWLLPTSPALQDAINELIKINEDPNSFALIETDRPIATASKLVRILPSELAEGQSIDRDGDLRSEESAICGIAEEDAEFKQIYLLRHSHPRINYGTDEDNRRMLVVTKHRLDELLNTLMRLAVPGNLIIDKSFDPDDTGLHSVGRALMLRHENLPVTALGVLAHRAGFDFVENEGTQIYASVAPGDMLDIVASPSSLMPTPGRRVDLSIAPQPLPLGGQINWMLIPCGNGRAHFESYPADSGLSTPVTSRQRLRFVADTPGEITVKLEYTYQRRTVSATHTIRIVVSRLISGEHIAENGNTEMGEAEAVGGPEDDFNQIYLITHDSDVDYGSDPNNRVMQIVLEKPFNRLIQLLKNPVLIRNLRILKAYDSSGTGLHRVGRALLIQHAVLSPGILGALAHRVGFGYVERRGNEIYCAVAAGEKIEVARAADLTRLDDQMEVGNAIQLRARFTELPTSGGYNWSIHEIGKGKGSFNLVLRPHARFTPTEPGLLLLNVTYLAENAQSTFPYTFEVKLRESLDVPGTIIAKHQYDLIMNILNYYHPIGVEVITQNIREHVVEVKDNLLDAFPGYTYPDFRD